MAIKVKVYILLWDNYGDQGVDYLGVFPTKEDAQLRIYKETNDIDEYQNFEIIEETVDVSDQFSPG